MVKKLGCNETCCFHVDCYKALMDYYKEQEEDACCPVCQQEIEDDAVEEVPFEEVKSP